VTRPLLLPGLPRVWRSADELQLGADPFRAVVVRLPDSRTAVILDLLDGTRSERAVLARSAELGIPADQSHALIATLRAAGLVRPATELIPNGLPPATRRRLIGEAAALARTTTPSPAETLRRRWHSRVVINGHGRLAAPIAVALAESGVGQVRPEVPGVVGPGELPGSPLRPTDLGRPRRAAISDAVLRAAPDTRTPPVRRPPTPPPVAPAPEREPATSSREPVSPAPERAASLHEPGESTGEPDARTREQGSTREPATPSRPPAAQARGQAASVREPAAVSREPVARVRVRTAMGSEPGESAGEAGAPVGASVVVELDQDVAPDWRAEARRVGREPRLAVTIRDGVPVVGPFVPAVGGPCLHCIELHRRDRDASWPGVAPRPRTEPAEPCTIAGLLTATAYIVDEILAHLDGGGPETLGAAVEISGPGRLRRRSWPPHPACPCTGPAA
jgi:hypothetical protein